MTKTSVLRKSRKQPKSVLNKLPSSKLIEKDRRKRSVARLNDQIKVVGVKMTHMHEATTTPDKDAIDDNIELVLPFINFNFNKIYI